MSRASDVAVIGAGVFGAWSALLLRRSGRSVTLIDAFGAGNTRSSSGGASRVFRVGYGHETLYSRWAQRSFTAWLELFRDSRQELFTRTGVLWMARADDPATDETVETLGQLKVPFETLDRTELEQRYPQLTFGPITRGVLEPEAGVIMARRAVQAVVRQAIKQSVDYRVAAVQPPNGNGPVDALVTSDGDRIRAGTYVFACGPWLPKLFPAVLGDRLHPTRQEVFSSARSRVTDDSHLQRCRPGWTWPVESTVCPTSKAAVLRWGSTTTGRRSTRTRANGSSQTGRCRSPG